MGASYWHEEILISLHRARARPGRSSGRSGPLQSRKGELEVAEVQGRATMVIRTVRAFSRPKIRRRFWKSLQVRVLRKILTMLGRNQGSSWNDFHGTAQSSFLVIMHLASTMCHVCGLASVHSNCHFIRDKPRPCKNPILWGFGLCLQEHSAVV